MAQTTERTGHWAAPKPPPTPSRRRQGSNAPYPSLDTATDCLGMRRACGSAPQWAPPSSARVEATTARPACNLISLIQRKILAATDAVARAASRLLLDRAGCARAQAGALAARATRSGRPTLPARFAASERTRPMTEVTLTFPDGSKRPYKRGISGRDLAAAISKSLAKKAVA